MKNCSKNIPALSIMFLYGLAFFLLDVTFKPWILVLSTFILHTAYKNSKSILYFICNSLLMLDGIRIIHVPAGSKMSYPLAILAYVIVSKWQINLSVRFINSNGSRYKITSRMSAVHDDYLLALSL